MSLLLRRRQVGVPIQVPYGLRFNYATEGTWLSTANENNFDFGSNSFSFTFYFQVNALGTQGIISKRTGGNNGYFVYTNGRRIYLSMYNGSLYVLLTPAVCTPGIKYYTTINIKKETSGWTYDIYIDNTLQATHFESNNNNFDNVNSFEISRENLTSPGSPTGMDGYLYDLKCFSKELTGAERIELYNSKGEVILLTAQSSLIADWRFNDAEGFGAIDETGNNNASLTSYTVPQTTRGVDNYWVDKNNNPIL